MNPGKFRAFMTALPEWPDWSRAGNELLLSIGIFGCGDRARQKALRTTWCAVGRFRSGKQRHNGHVFERVRKLPEMSELQELGNKVLERLKTKSLQKRVIGEP
jgi:hypothetical protein